MSYGSSSSLSSPATPAERAARMAACEEALNGPYPPPNPEAIFAHLPSWVRTADLIKYRLPGHRDERLAVVVTLKSPRRSGRVDTLTVDYLALIAITLLTVFGGTIGSNSNGKNQVYAKLYTARLKNLGLARILLGAGSRQEADPISAADPLDLRLANYRLTPHSRKANQLCRSDAIAEAVRLCIKHSGGTFADFDRYEGLLHLAFRRLDQVEGPTIGGFALSAAA